MLTQLEGFKAVEVAEALNVPVNTVYTRLHHVRQAFRDALEKSPLWRRPVNHLDDLERLVLRDAHAYLEPNSTDESRVYARLVDTLGLSGATTTTNASTLVYHFQRVSSRFVRALRRKRAAILALATVGTLAGVATGYQTGLFVWHKSARTVGIPSVIVPVAPRQAVKTRNNRDDRAVGADRSPERASTNEPRAFADSKDSNAERTRRDDGNKDPFLSGGSQPTQTSRTSDSFVERAARVGTIT